MSGLKWFRAYAGIVDDDKLRLLAFEDRWHFVALCALKCSGLLDEPDSLLRNRKIAVKLGVQVRELEEISRRLQEVGLIDKNLNPTKWDDLQYRSDKSTERVKKYREKQHRNGVKRFSNVSETAQETDTETDISSKEDSSAGADRPPTESEIIEAWNQRMVPQGFSAVRRITPDRKRHLKARIRESTFDDWQRAFAAIERSAFCRGENDRGWRANFDFLLQPKSFTKLIEGAYDH
jgi:hypothetical protein